MYIDYMHKVNQLARSHSPTMLGILLVPYACTDAQRVYVLYIYMYLCGGRVSIMHMYTYTVYDYVITLHLSLNWCVSVVLLV